MPCLVGRKQRADRPVRALRSQTLGEEARPRPTSRLTALRRGAGSSRAGTAAKHVFVFKPWCVRARYARRAVGWHTLQGALTPPPLLPLRSGRPR